MENPKVRGAGVAIEELSRYYGAVKAVYNVRLNVEPGEFLSLVGPSGSGKTTLLMMVAGFEEPTAGRIIVGSRDLTRVPPNLRNMGMVFQRYALFPHMSVADNIAFPLRMRALSRAERDERVARALDMVKLSGFGDRRPAQLSGGQQQRVALARAIVFEPQVVLMDEPLGALDRKLRQHMQIELKDLQARLGATVIYVTHDQEEALTMSDRVAILKDGELCQVGRPRDVYDHPASAFVGDFFGEMNFLTGVIEHCDTQACRVRVGNHAITAASAGQAATPGALATIGTRPEYVSVGAGDNESADNAIAGKVVRVVFSGPAVMVLIEFIDGTTIKASVSLQSDVAGLPPGSPVTVSFSPSHTVAFAPGAADARSA